MQKLYFLEIEWKLGRANFWKTADCLLYYTWIRRI